MSQGLAVESNPAPAAPAAPAPAESQAPVVPAGTPEGQNGPAQTQEQGASVEEQFSNVDPKTLPPELQAIYKSMQADYTKKTQKAAEAAKKAEAYDQLTGDQRFRDYWSGLSRKEKTEFKEQKAEVEKTLGQKITDDEFSKAFENKDNFLNLLKRVADDSRSQDQKRIQELEQKLTVNEAADVVEAFATEIGQDGKPLRPDFYEMNDPKYNLITGFLQVNPPEDQSPQAYTERLNQAYSWAKSLTQDFYAKGKNEALSIIQKKAAASSQPPTQAAKNSVSAKDAKNITPREALEMAKRGERIPQVYD